jgi:hypothetical protein
MENRDFWNKPGALKKGSFFVHAIWSIERIAVVFSERHAFCGMNPNMNRQDILDRLRQTDLER